MVICSSFPMRSIQFYQHLVRCLILQWVRSYKAVNTLNSQPKQLNLTFIYFKHCFLSDTFIYTRECLKDWGLGLEKKSHFFFSQFLLVFPEKKIQCGAYILALVNSWFLKSKSYPFFWYRSSNEEKTICT